MLKRYVNRIFHGSRCGVWEKKFVSASVATKWRFVFKFRNKWNKMTTQVIGWDGWSDYFLASRRGTLTPSNIFVTFVWPLTVAIIQMHTVHVVIPQLKLEHYRKFPHRQVNQVNCDLELSLLPPCDSFTK